MPQKKSFCSPKCIHTGKEEHNGHKRNKTHVNLRIRAQRSACTFRNYSTTMHYTSILNSPSVSKAHSRFPVLSPLMTAMQSSLKTSKLEEKVQSHDTERKRVYHNSRKKKQSHDTERKNILNLNVHRYASVISFLREHRHFSMPLILITKSTCFKNYLSFINYVLLFLSV